MKQRHPTFKPWPLMIALIAIVLIVGAALSQLLQFTSSGNAGLLPTSQSPVLSDTPVAVSPSSQPSPLPGNTETEVPTPNLQMTDAFLATDAAWKQVVGITAQYLVTTIDTPEPGPTGIVDGPEAGLSPQVYSVKNRWYGAVNGHTIAAYAGALAGDGEQGMVYVIEWTDPRVEHQYLTPLRVGSVRIVAEQNLRLSLASAYGTTLYFDVPGQTFVDSLTEIVPTVTPFQTYTPVPTITPPPTHPLEPTCTPGPTPAIATAEADCIAD